MGREELVAKPWQRSLLQAKQPRRAQCLPPGSCSLVPWTSHCLVSVQANRIQTSLKKNLLFSFFPGHELISAQMNSGCQLPFAKPRHPKEPAGNHFRFNRGGSQVWEGDKMITRIFSASARPPPALTEPLVQMGEPARAAALVLPLWVGASPTLGQPRLVLRVIKQ